jgi:hypothetical protein
VKILWGLTISIRILVTLYIYIYIYIHAHTHTHTHTHICGSDFNINLHHLFVHMLVYNKHLLFNMHDMNIKVTTRMYIYMYIYTGLA